MMKYALIGVAAIIGVGIAVPVINMVTQPFRTASGVISRTMDPNNVITRYEWFHDAYAQYQSRVRQIRVSKGMLSNETDNAEKQRIRIELMAQQSNCRDLATRYNANATKTNVSIFQGREAPPTLDINACE